MISIKPTGAEGVWLVRLSECDLHDTAVYRYQSGLWRCQAHPGERDCEHIQQVQRSVP